MTTKPRSSRAVVSGGRRPRESDKAAQHFREPQIGSRFPNRGDTSLRSEMSHLDSLRRVWPRLCLPPRHFRHVARFNTGSCCCQRRGYDHLHRGTGPLGPVLRVPRALGGRLMSPSCRPMQASMTTCSKARGSLIEIRSKNGCASWEREVYCGGR